MAAIFQINRGSGSISLVDGELYINKGPDSLQYAVGEREITLAKLDELNSGSLYIQGGISASGDITASNMFISGNLHISGNLFLGNSGSDTITATGEFTSHIIPNPTDTYNLGSDTKRWGRMFANSVSASAFTGSLYGMGDPTSFSTSVDLRLDRVEASSSLYDNAMSGSKRLYVSPSGSDSNDGQDPSTPFRTIKAAVESLGSAIASNIQRTTIFVGSGNYTENNPIAVPPGVAIVGDTLRTVRLTASNPTKDYFHCHDGNYFYGLRFLDLKYPAFAFSFPCSTATATISGGGVSGLIMKHTESGYVDGESVSVIIEGPDASGSAATATATVSGGTLSINMVSNGSGYVAGEKPHVSIQSPTSKRPLIGTSPYIQNCSSITGPITTDGTALSLNPASANYAPLPYNINDVRNASNAVIGSGIIDEQGAGGGIRIDGNLVSGSSPLESFVADAFTQVNQGGPGHLVINKGYAQFVSCFTTFCTYGFKVVSGGFANISNSVIDFGAKGLVSKTYFPQTYNTGSSLQTLTSTVVGAVIQQDGAGYTGSVASVTISGGGGSGATAEATVNANGSINEIVILTPGSGYTSQPNVTIATPTGAGAIQATTVAGKANISGIAAILFQLESGSRGVDVSSNMILSGTDYLVTNVATGSSANQRYVTVYPAPPSITTGNSVYFHQLSNISTGGLVMEYVGSGVTYNALPKYGGVPNRNREIIEYAPGRVFYSTVDNIGNLKIGDFFAVNQLTGEVTIDANQFNLSGLSAIGPFKRNGVGVGVILNEVSNNTTLLNAQGITGEDTVPTQFAIKTYVDIISGSVNGHIVDINTKTGSFENKFTAVGASTSSLNIFSASVNGHIVDINTKTGSFENKWTTLQNVTSSILSYTSSLKSAIELTGSSVTILGNLVVKGTQLIVDSTTIQLGDNILELNGAAAANGGLLVKDTTGTSGSLLWDSTNDYWKGGTIGNEEKLLRAGSDGVISGSSQITYASISSIPAGIVSGSAQVTPLLPTGVVSGSSQITYASISSIPAGIVSGSTQVTPLLPTGTVSGSSQTIANLPVGTVSGSSQITYTGISSIPSGIVSGSSQITPLLPTGVVSGSSQITYANISSIPAGIVSGSTQVTPLLPTGTVSGSLQVTLSSTTGYGTVINQNLLTTSDVTHNTITGIINATNGVVSGSSQMVGILESLNSFTGSTYSTFSQSVDTRLDNVEYLTGLLGGGLDTSLQAINLATASLQTFSASALLDLNNLHLYTASTNTRLSRIEESTASVNSFTASNGNTSLNSYTASNDTTNTAQNTRLTTIESVTGSYETKGIGIVSGSSQITYTGISSIPVGIVSGSSQITYTNISSIPAGIVSGSSQITYASISSIPSGIVSGSSQVTGIGNAQLTNSTISGIALGSNLATLTIGTGLSGTSYNGGGAVTITNTGVTSITTNTGLSTNTSAAGAVTITNTGVTSITAGTGISISSGTGGVTIDIGQAVATTSNVRFGSIGIGTTASGVAGELRATGDITAFYSSDVRLKENIQPIENALSKVESISGNTYDWKEGFESIHSHTGHDIGVIAQEIEKVLPEVVTNRETGYKAVQYEKIVPLLIEAIKELSAKVRELESK